MPRYCPVWREYGHHGKGIECKFCFCNPANRPEIARRDVPNE